MFFALAGLLLARFLSAQDLNRARMDSLLEILEKNTVLWAVCL
jgi:hypothetical protein